MLSKKILFIVFILSSIYLFAENIKLSQLILTQEASTDITLSAEEFNKFYQKMGGEKLPVIPFEVSLLTKSGGVFLGEAAIRAGVFTSVEIEETGKNGGFRLREKDGNIYIAAASPQGTLYGVYALLEKMGCKFYSPDHEVVPKHANLKLQKCDILKVPYFETRLISNATGNVEKIGFHDSSKRPGWFIRPDLHIWDWTHTDMCLVPPTVWGKEHPEYYAMRADGKRHIGSDADRKTYLSKLKCNNLQLCMSNPEVRKIANRNFKKWIEEQPGRILYMVTQNDGYNTWCMCGKCKNLDTVPGKIMTDRLLYFVNEIARDNPDVTIATLIYGGTTLPLPQRVMPEKNVKLFLCPYPPEANDKGHWFDHPDNRKFMPYYQAWKDKYPGQIYIYEYPYAAYGMLWLDFVHEGQFFRLKQYAKDGIKGFYYCMDGPPFMLSLFLHVTSKLSWNPELSTNALVSDFINSYYGQAAPGMQEIYNKLKQISVNPERSTANPMKDFLTIDECFELLELFDKAGTKVKSNNIYSVRVNTDKAFLLRTFLDNYNPVNGNAKDIGIFKRRLAEYLTILQNSDFYKLKRWGLMTSRFKQDHSKWFLNIAGFDVTDAKNWQESAIIKTLLTEPEKVEIAIKQNYRSLVVLNNGWQIPLENMEGVDEEIEYGGNVFLKKAVIIQNMRHGNSKLSVDFSLPLVPKNCILQLVAQNNGKPFQVPIRITLNSRKIFDGASPFEENEWSTCDLKLPNEILKRGKNKLLIENVGESSAANELLIALHSIEILTTEKLGKNAYLTFFAPYSTDIDAEYAAGIAKPLNIKKSIYTNVVFKILDESLDAGISPVTSRWPGGILSYASQKNLPVEEGTIELEVKTAWTPSNDKNHRVFFDSQNNDKTSGFNLFKATNGKDIVLEAYSNKTKRRIFIPIEEWKANIWYKIQFGWSKDTGKFMLMIDGRKAKGKIDFNNVGKNFNRFTIGTMHDNMKNFNPGCYIRNFKIYSKNFLE